MAGGGRAAGRLAELADRIGQHTSPRALATGGGSYPPSLLADQEDGQNPGPLSGPGPVAQVSPGCGGRLLA